MKGKSCGTGLPDLDWITKLEKSPKKKNWFNTAEFRIVFAWCGIIQFPELSLLEVSEHNCSVLKIILIKYVLN